MGVVRILVRILFLVLVSPVDASDPLAPAIALRDMRGAEQKVTYPDGKVTLVHFWATWCVPCREELPQLIRLVEANKARGLALLLIAADSRTATIDYARQRKWKFNVLVDQYGKALHDYKVKGLPTTVIIGREGREIARHQGMLHWLEPGNVARIEGMLKR